MKGQRSILAPLASGTALYLVPVAVLMWIGGSVPDRPGLPSPSAGTEPADAETALESDYSALLLQSQGEVLSSAEPPSTATVSSFLQGLGTTLSSIQAESDAELKAEKLEDLAAGIDATELPAAAAFLHQQTNSEAAQELGRLVLRRWTENDPQAAADWVSEWPVGESRDDAIRDVAVLWAGQDFSSAVEWVRHLDDIGARQIALAALAYEAARTEPIEALKLALELPADDTARNDLLVHTARQWASSDPQAAVEWAKQIPDAALRRRVLAGVATSLGTSDPVTAANLAVKELPAGRQQDAAVVGIVQRWAQSSPETAAAWVSSFPESRLRTVAAENLVKLWAEKNQEQSGQWVKSLEPGFSRDAAMAAYVSKLTPKFPGTAAQWTELINDEARRFSQMRAVAESWMTKDATAALTWIGQTAMPDAFKKSALSAAPTEPR